LDGSKLLYKQPNKTNSYRHSNLLNNHTLLSSSPNPTTMPKPIAFIIGAGKNIGLSTAATLQSKGYRIALAARSLNPKDSTLETLHLALDLSRPEAVGSAFASLREQWGEPSIVFYNGENNSPEVTSVSPQSPY
jgi:NAD(P)-dependent dehydrogenase (short-subunit alcohol dehydrogenase family)